MWGLAQSTSLQTGETPAPDTPPPSVESLRRLLRGIPTCMVTTRSDQIMRTRPMMLRTIDAAGRLLFLANQRSHLVGHLAEHPEVSLTFVHPDEELYVAISGAAEIDSDPAQIRPLWTWAYRIWHPLRWRDPNLVLLAVTVTDVEYWVAPSTIPTRLFRSIQRSLTHRPHNNATHGMLIVETPHAPLP